MKFFLRNIKISWAIILIAALPSLVTIFLSGKIFIKEFQKVQNLKQLSTLTELSIKMSDLVHEIQKERGVTAGFLGSRGKSFTQELKTQRKETDKKLNQLKKYIKQSNFKAFDRNFNKKLKISLSKTKTLNHIRNKVDAQKIKVLKSIASYTKINFKKLSTISYMMHLNLDSKIAIHLMAYTNFLKSKERSGLERAIGVSGLVAGKFSPKALKSFISLSTAQKIYTQLFLTYAKKDQIEKYEKISQSFEFKEVSRIRKIIYSGGTKGQLQGITSKYWFNNITKKINKLKEIEDLISNDLKIQMASLIRVSKLNKLRSVSSVFFSLILIALFSGLMIHTINSSFHKVVQSTIELAKGNLKVKLPQKTKNEIGDIVKSLEVFRENGLKKRQMAIELRKQRRNLEKEVKKRTIDLTNSNAELEEFSYRTSHDLRAPLISSIGLLTVAQSAIKKNILDKALKSIGYAKSSLQKLEVLVQEILNLAKAKNENEEMQKVEIKVLLEDTIKKFSHLENFKRLKFKKDLKFNDPLFLKKNRLVLIVENMISNAIKYQDLKKDSSFVEISTYSLKDQLRSYFILEVKDNGLGIPKEHQKKLFTMFKRFHSNVSFGSGLGLYIMKKSAEVLNGKLTCESQAESTIFKIKIPIHPLKRRQVA